ncbi:alpha/beta fold hydrolase [Gracilibacillus xinjiangensis]|uniref:Alpha/beta fold hydrolase n=1 Tax=Gracilibacillus xinjiangensis TaxID=1193282 RepID=A0ABV8WZP2_9BACI
MAIDQRGVLRSDAIDKNKDVGLKDIIADCEAIRIELGIQEWVVLGHSFGGYLAMKYAYEYPNFVKKVIYEAPSFDLGLSAKSLIKNAISLLEKESKMNYLTEYTRYMDGSSSSKEIWKALGNIYKELSGEKKDKLYLKSLEPCELNHISKFRRNG